MGQIQLRQIIGMMGKPAASMGVWEDDFSGASLDTSKWSVSHTGGFPDPVQNAGNIEFTFVWYTLGNGHFESVNSIDMRGRSVIFQWADLAPDYAGYAETDILIFKDGDTTTRALWNFSDTSSQNGVIRLYNSGTQVTPQQTYTGLTPTYLYWRISHSGAGAGTWKFEKSTDGSTWTTICTMSGGTWIPTDCKFSIDCMYWGSGNSYSGKAKLTSISTP